MIATEIFVHDSLLHLILETIFSAKLIILIFFSTKLFECMALGL